MDAHFVEHAYERHAHDSYAFGLTRSGTQVFQCRGGTHASSTGMVMTMNPEDPHDGHAGSPGGFTYQMLYVDAHRVADALAQASGSHRGLPLFRTPVVLESALATRVGRAAAALLDGAPPLLVDELVDLMIVDLARHAGTWSVEIATGRRPLGRAVDLLHARYAEGIRADELAAAAGMSRFQLYRAFNRRYGLPPSAYQRQLRLRAARALLAAGQPPGDVAAAVGFADQAHLSRWFRRAYGITPAVYRRA
jgi:AraC-like DNA-binding protein